MLGVESEHDCQHSFVPHLPNVDLAGLQVEAENAVAADLAAAACEVDAPGFRAIDVPAIVVQRPSVARHRMWRTAAGVEQEEPASRRLARPRNLGQVKTTTGEGDYRERRRAVEHDLVRARARIDDVDPPAGGGGAAASAARQGIVRIGEAKPIT